VFPLVRKEIPEARFVIVGSEPTSEVLALEGKGVVVRGYIEDLRAMFESCRLTVAPLRYGAGYKGKIAMSLAHGVPCVATSIAAEGMQLTVGREILVADEAAAIASAVARLYSDAQLWERLSRAGLDFAAERFSAHAARHKIDLTLRMAGAKAWPDSTIVPASHLEKDPGIAIFPSRFMRDLHRKGGVAYRRAVLVPHGVDFAHPEDAPRAPRDRLVVPGELRLLFTGRVTEIKGVRTAIEAVRVISDALPDLGVRLTIVGDQTDEGYVERCRGLVHELELQGRVFFEPSLPEKELFALFQAHDVLVFPSLFEPFALTLILGMEAGIPVVASLAGGTVDIVRERSTGMLFQPGDARGLAAAVVELASDPVLRAVVSQGGRAAASPLTIEKMVDRIEVELREAST
jgi:glycosyltransferase involved in cell wall biosynthesis